MHLYTDASYRRRRGLPRDGDGVLGVVLIGNNLLNTIIPVLTTSIALRTFGRDNLVLSIATGIVAFLIIVFAEITPKIVGATYPEKIALPASVVIAPLMRVLKPAVWLDMNSGRSVWTWISPPWWT